MSRANGEPPLMMLENGVRYRRTCVLRNPEDGKLHGIYAPVMNISLYTADWIGKPPKQDVEFFLWCMFATVARRSRAGKSKHQKEQMTGEFITYGKSKGQRESDFQARIYAAVRLLVLSGKSLQDAFLTIAEHPHVKPRLHATKRGRRPQTLRERDALDQANDVKSFYYKYRTRHRWPEKLPHTDAELEFFWGYFLKIREWAFVLMTRIHQEGKRKRISPGDFLSRLSEAHAGWSEREVLVLTAALRIYGGASQLAQIYSSASTASSINSRTSSASSPSNPAAKAR